MAVFAKKGLVYFLLSMFINVGAQGKVLCVADGHVEIESSMMAGCSSTSEESCQDCTDIDLSFDSFRTDDASHQLINQLKMAPKVRLVGLGDAFLNFEVNFSPQKNFLDSRRSFPSLTLLEKKVTILLI